MVLKRFLYIISFLLIFTKCVEPTELKETTSNNFLVIEALLTNELKKHTIKLSRTTTVNSESSIQETGATVQIFDSSQNIYNFSNTTEGIYISDIAFKAELNEEYTLKIITENGNIYESSKEKIAGTAIINELKPIKETNSLNEEGIQVYVNGESINNDAVYFRYRYEETYKIIAPFWTEDKIEIDASAPTVINIVPDTESARICYQTQQSNSIIQTEISNLSDRKINFGTRFIQKNDYLISNRYSILVKQYVQTEGAYTYFKKLNNLSSLDNVFSQSQPGFIIGNINSTTNANEKVIGYFEVASVSEKRVFFNGEDFYTNVTSEYPSECSLSAPVVMTDSGATPLFNFINNENFIYYTEVGPNTNFPNLTCLFNNTCGPYILVKKACGDCREIGTDIKPNFWID